MFSHYSPVSATNRLDWRMPSANLLPRYSREIEGKGGAETDDSIALYTLEEKRWKGTSHRKALVVSVSANERRERDAHTAPSARALPLESTVSYIALPVYVVIQWLCSVGACLIRQSTIACPPHSRNLQYRTWHKAQRWLQDASPFIDYLASYHWVPPPMKN